MPSTTKTRRHFTQAARDAAARARQEKGAARLLFPDQHNFAMFVVRASGSANSFRWEIRRFGRLEPMAESETSFACPRQARLEGERALQGFLSDRGSGLPRQKKGLTEATV